MADARHDLLDRIIDDVARTGLGDRSLRDLAAAVGSSHRMLLYHFGSRPGLVAAIVHEVERRQREFMTAAEPGDDPLAVARVMWRRVSDPELRPFVQLFFEVAAYASRAAGGGDDLTLPWVDDAVAVSETLGQAADPVTIRLGVAVVRGLLVDVIGGGDLEGATAAFERYLELGASLVIDSPAAPPRLRSPS